MTKDGELGEAETVPESAGGPTPSGDTKPSSRGVITVGPGAALGRYQVGDELGAGGMASVFQARDPQLRRDVAIKVMFPHLAKKPEVARRFQREARAAAGLEHPNILRVYDVGGGRVEGAPEDEPPYIVMELVRGKSLRELGDGGAILAEVVACMGALLCDALAAAHEAGVIHRDVKPGNVMTTEDGRLLLADFGVARIEDDDSLVTKTGALLGTPSFMSPEQAHGGDLDGRSDLYSVGATLYQLATGSAPFAGPTAVVVAAILHGDFVPPERRRPEIGPDLARAIRRLMSLKPEGRPADARAAAEMLREVVVSSGFGEPREELAAYLRDPAKFEAERRPRILERTVERARAAMANRAIPRAIGLVDRALALDPGNAQAIAIAAQISRGDRRRRVLVIGGVFVAAAAVATGGVWIATRPSTAAAPDAASATATDAATGTATATDAATGTATGTDAATGTGTATATDAGTGTATATDAATGTATATDAATATATATDAGTVSVHHPRKPVDAAVPMIAVDAAPVVVIAAPDAAPAPPAPGAITVSFDAWCDLSIDGTSVGRADPKKKYPADPGPHQLACTQGQGLATWRGNATVTSGKTATVRGSLLASVRVTIAVAGGDQVRIGGATHGNGATVELHPGRLRVEVLKGGTVVTTGWVSLPQIAACTIKDRPDLDCYP